MIGRETVPRIYIDNKAIIANNRADVEAITTMLPPLTQDNTSSTPSLTPYCSSGCRPPT